VHCVRVYCCVHQLEIKVLDIVDERCNHEPTGRVVTYHGMFRSVFKLLSTCTTRSRVSVMRCGDHTGRFKSLSPADIS
jgi:hypothetical protein